MSDFTDFLAAMAIEDAMEDDKEVTTYRKPPRRNIKTKSSTGSKISLCSIIVGVILGLVFLSFWLFAGISVAGLMTGLYIDTFCKK